MINMPFFVLLYAFRYALHRTTSATVDICDILISNWDKIEKEFQAQILKDIEQEKMVCEQLSGNLSEEWLRLSWPQWQRLIDFVKGKDND